KRTLAGSDVLLIRTATCAEELEVAADSAMGSEPDPAELRGSAERARRAGALCFPGPGVGSEYVISVDGLSVRVIVDGDTLPGARNNAENLCGPDGQSGLAERLGALPPGSA